MMCEITECITTVEAFLDLAGIVYFVVKVFIVYGLLITDDLSGRPALLSVFINYCYDKIGN